MRVAICAQGARNCGVLASGGASGDNTRIDSTSVSIITSNRELITNTSGDVARLRVAKIGVIAHFADVFASEGGSRIVARISSARVLIITANTLTNTDVIHTGHRVARIGSDARKSGARNARKSGEVGVDTGASAWVARIHSASIAIITSLVGELTSRGGETGIISAIVVIIA